MQWRPPHISVQEDDDGLFTCLEDTVEEADYVRKDIVDGLVETFEAVLEMHIAHHNSALHSHARVMIAKAKDQ